MSSKKSNPKLCKDKNIKYVPPHPNLHKSPDNHRYTLCSQGRRGIKKNWKNKLILITANETQGLSVTAYIRSVSIWNILWVQFLAQPTDFNLLQSIGHRITSYLMGCNYRDTATSSNLEHSPLSAAKHSYLYCLHVPYDA